MEKIIKIAVCDDEKDMLDRIEQSVANYKPLKDVNRIEVVAYNDSRLLEEDIVKTAYNLVMVDIEMPGINGFDLAGRIHDIRKSTEIVFVSNHENLVYQTFKFRPFRFVRKLHLEDELLEALRAYENQHNLENEPYVEFRTPVGMKKIRPEDIYYIESGDHTVTIYHARGVFTATEGLGRAEELLAGTDVIRVHKGFLVNIAQVERYIRSSLELKNGSTVNVGRSYKNQVRAKLEDYKRRHNVV